MHLPFLSRRAPGVVVALLVLAGIGSAVWLEPLPLDSRQAGEGTDADEVLLDRVRVGHQIQNHFRLRLEGKFGSQYPSQKVELNGRWVRTVVDIEDGLTHVACELTNLGVRLESGDDPGGQASSLKERTEAERVLEAALRVRFFVSYRATGALAGLWLSKEVGSAPANLLVTLASTGQFVRKPGDHDAWITSERDVHGRYTATYRLKEPGRFEKRKVNYLRAHQTLASRAVAVPTQTPSESPATRIERSRYDLRVGEAGHVIEGQAEEKLSADFGAGGFSIETALFFELDQPKLSRAPEAVGTFVREKPGLEWYPIRQYGADHDSQRAQRDRIVLGGASFEDLVGELRASSEDGLSERTESLNERFAALFRRSEESVLEVLPIVRTLEGAQGGIVVDALSAAATEPAQAVLGAIGADTGVSRALRKKAIQYLPRQSRVTTKAVTVIADLLDDDDPEIRQVARFAYGACARKIYEKNYDEASRMVDLLLQRLERSAELAERTELIIALGNAGHEKALPVLKHSIGAMDASLRLPAIEALRFIEGSEADDVLLSLLGNAKDAIARVAAIQTVRHREAGPFIETLVEVARKDPEKDVRGAAIDLLGARLARLPTLRSVLERVAQNDLDRQNRRRAAEYLARSGATEGP